MISDVKKNSPLIFSKACPFESLLLSFYRQTQLYVVVRASSSTFLVSADATVPLENVRAVFFCEEEDSLLLLREDKIEVFGLGLGLGVVLNEIELPESFSLCQSLKFGQSETGEFLLAAHRGRNLVLAIFDFFELVTLETTFEDEIKTIELSGTHIRVQTSKLELLDFSLQKIDEDEPFSPPENTLVVQSEDLDFCIAPNRQAESIVFSSSPSSSKQSTLIEEKAAVSLPLKVDPQYVFRPSKSSLVFSSRKELNLASFKLPIFIQASGELSMIGQQISSIKQKARSTFLTKLASIAKGEIPIRKIQGKENRRFLRKALRTLNPAMIDSADSEKVGASLLRSWKRKRRESKAFQSRKGSASHVSMGLEPLSRALKAF